MREDSQLCFSSVSQPCPTLCNPMICSTPGLPVHHQLPKFTQTHAHRMLMPSSHLILCRPLLLLPPIPPSIRVFSNESTLRMRWPKYWIHCVFETSSVTDYWQKFFGFFFFFFSVLPVRAPNLTMQCAQIQINHHYAGLWTGHDFHPELPSFATCSKVCTDASEMEWASVGWKMVPSSIKMAMAHVCSRVYFLPLKTFLK